MSKIKNDECIDDNCNDIIGPSELILMNEVKDDSKKIKKIIDFFNNYEIDIYDIILKILNDEEFI